jgi:methyl-accepting chemotaxis protein
MRHPIIMAGLSAAVGLLLCACGQSKITECNALVEVLNKGAKDIHDRTNVITSKPEAVAEYKALADTADQVAEGASKVEIRSPELKKLSSDYQNVMREFAKAARDIAAADTKDIAKMNTAANNMEKIGKEEEQLVADINKYCQAP